MNGIKKIISAVLVCAMILLTLPAIAIPTKATNDSYYEDFGINYEQLFTLYPDYLDPSQETAVVNSLINAYKATLGEYGGDHDFLPSFMYALDQGGAEILSSEILAKFGIGKSTEEKLIADTSEALMREILQAQSGLDSVTNEIADNFKNLKNTYNLATSVGKLEFINDLKTSSKKLSHAEIDKLADKLFENESKLMSNIGDGIEFWQLIVGIVELHELQEESICQLRDSLEDNSDFARALDELLKRIEKDPVAYMLEHYCTKTALELLSDAIQTMILGGRESPSKLTFALAKILVAICFKMYPGAMADEIYQTTLLSSYVSEFGAAIDAHRTQFALAKVGGELVGLDDIGEYEYLYSAYITTICETLKSALDTAKTDGQRGNVQNAINLCNTFTYETYITWCMTNVKADIDAGLIAAPGSIAGNASACVKETYPSYGKLVITKDSANIMDRPCSVKTDATAQLVESGALDAEYTVTGLYLNTADNYWYQIITKNGGTGYIYSGNCTFKEFLSDAVLTGLDVPSHIDVGSRYWIKGTVSTVYTNLSTVSFLVYDQNGTFRTGGTVDVSGKSYVLDYSDLDTATEFNILPAGKYRCVIQATLENNFASGCWTEKITLHTSEFTVISAYNAQVVVSLANNQVNSNWENNMCLSYIMDLFYRAYGLVPRDDSRCCAYHNGNCYLDSTSREAIPLGTCIYFGGSKVQCCGDWAGHIAIYVGNNNIIHAWDGKIVCTTIDYVINCGYPYRGYGWYADQPLQTVCNHNYISVEVPASCETTGTREYTCSSCGDTYSETIEALGHNYAATKTDATCTTAGYTTYTCIRCNDSYVETSDGWSEWSAEYPTGVPESLIEQKTQYSTLEKEYTTSTSDILDGWTNCGITYSNWGPVQTTTTKPTESSTLRITDTAQTGWGYYHWCNYYYNGGNNWNIDSVQYGGPCYWHGYTSDFELPGIYFQDQGGQQAYGGIGTGASPCPYNFYIWFRDTGADVYTYSYQTRSEVKQFYKWSDKWSDWVDTEVTGNEDRQVKTQILYRYHINGLADHNYSYAVTIAPTSDITGILTGTCGACADTTTVTLPKLNTVDYTYSVIKEPSCTEPGTGRYTWNVTTYGYFYFDINKTLLKFAGASLSLQHNLAINYKVDKVLFENVGYSDPYVVFELNGVETRVSDYTISDDKYVFTFRNIAPNQMNDTIRATLYATYDGTVYASETREYSVSQYCYSMLDSCKDDKYAKLRTLLVDLLYYGAASQTYTDYKADTLVNASLTEEQMQWGTSTNPTLTSVLDTTYITVAEPSARWKGAGLNLQESVSIRLKFTAESVEGLTVRIESDDRIWTISSDKFLEEDGVYYVYFTGLDAGQMRQSVYLTIYNGETPVSNTACYSIESYAAEKQNSTVENLPELVRAMMRYGDSAYAYIQ